MQHAERRLVGQALHFWQRLCGPRPCPSLADVEADHDERIWSHAFVLDIRDGKPAEFRFRHCGKELVAGVGNDFTGASIADLPAEFADDAIDLCLAAMRSRKPIAKSDYFFAKGGQEIRYRLILLPLSQNEQTVDCLFGAANYRQSPIT